MNPPETKPIRILLVDDHEVTRVGLRTILSHYPHLEIVGEAATTAAAIQQVEALLPDVVLLDVRLPDGTGFDVCRRIQQMEGRPIRVLVLTSFADDDTIFESIRSGADGFLLKEINAEALMRAIENVAAGKGYLDPSVTQRVLSRVRAPVSGAGKSRLESLSAQERRVLALVAAGKTNKEIGLELNLSEKTVKNYFSNTLEKLQMSRRSQAAAFYVQNTGS